MTEVHDRAGALDTGFRYFGGCPVGHGLARYDRLREVGSVVRVEESQGSYWVVLQRELIRSCLQDPATFSSRAVSPVEPDPPVTMIPLQLDPPEHRPWRQLLAGYFSPRRTQALRERMVAGCRELLDDIVKSTDVDFVSEFATRFPTVIFLEIMGLPVAELPRFLEWEHQILRGESDGVHDLDRQNAAVFEVLGYFTEQIQLRKAMDTVGEDIISQALTWQLDGHPVPDDAVLNCCLMLFLAGLDTVTNTLSYVLHHLATHDADRRRVVDAVTAAKPLADIVEELVRYYTVPALGRKVTREVELEGNVLREGEMVLFPFVSANRDPAFLPGADRVDLDRGATPHLAFGVGPHRCLGSHLAREELAVALEEWHRRIPEYAVQPGASIVETWGPVHGLASLPLRLGRGAGR